MNLWQLPKKVQLKQGEYDLHTDFRDILEVFAYLEDPDLPLSVRWRIALALFYEQPVLPEDRQQAMTYFCSFVTCGRQDPPGPRLFCCQQDAQEILSGVNRVAGQEVRNLPYVHWWTFLGWFHAIEEGAFSTLVGIRSKLAKGLALDPWETVFYRENRHRVNLKSRYSRRELEQQQALQQLLERPERKEKTNEK